MKIFKPVKKNLVPDMMDINDDFFSYSHAMAVGGNGYTLCGVADEEWGYTNTVPRKTISCPDCLGIIEYCKTYKAQPKITGEQLWKAYVKTSYDNYKDWKNLSQYHKDKWNAVAVKLIDSIDDIM